MGGGGKPPPKVLYLGRKGIEKKNNYYIYDFVE